MGDIGEVTSPCADSRILQCMKPLVSFFKKLGSQAIADDLFDRRDLWWFLPSSYNWLCLIYATRKILGDPSMIIKLVVLGSLFINWVMLTTVIYRHRDKPFRVVGAKMKFMIEVIPVIIAAALRLLEFNIGYLALLFGCTITFYVYAHFMHAAYDIGGKDALLGSVMQILAYMVNGELLVRALAWSFCVGLCFYRYMAYCAPQVPTHRKKLERLPC